MSEIAEERSEKISDSWYGPKGTRRRDLHDERESISRRSEELRGELESLDVELSAASVNTPASDLVPLLNRKAALLHLMFVAERDTKRIDSEAKAIDRQVTEEYQRQEDENRVKQSERKKIQERMAKIREILADPQRPAHGDPRTPEYPRLEAPTGIAALEQWGRSIVQWRNNTRRDMEERELPHLERRLRVLDGVEPPEPYDPAAVKRAERNRSSLYDF
jgi:hypothetical protein